MVNSNSNSNTNTNTNSNGLLCPTTGFCFFCSLVCCFNHICFSGGWDGSGIRRKEIERKFGVAGAVELEAIGLGFKAREVAVSKIVGLLLRDMFAPRIGAELQTIIDGFAALFAVFEIRNLKLS